MHIQHIVAVPDQRDDLAFGLSSLGFKLLAADKVVIEFDVLAPAELDWAAIHRADVIEFKAAVGNPVTLKCISTERLRKLLFALAVKRWNIIDRRRREAGFNMIDHLGPPPQSPDAKLGARFKQRIVNVEPIFARAVEFESDFARHALTEHQNLFVTDAG